MNRLESQWGEEFIGSLMDFMEEQGFDLRPSVTGDEATAAYVNDEMGARVMVKIIALEDQEGGV